MNSLITISAAADLIASGKPVAFAGSEESLDQLPRGNWIAGTIPYFMGAEGGVVSTDRVFASTLPENVIGTVAFYDANSLEKIVANANADGFSIVIIPAGGTAHRVFAERAASFPDAFLKPTVGWISGVHLSDLGKKTPKVYDGRTGQKYSDGAVVIHAALPDGALASIEIVNIFEPDDSDVLHFKTTGFEQVECLVNGKPRKLAEYLEERGNADCRLPLVGDFAGAHINVSLQSIDKAAGKVAFYAPVFEHVDYRLARPVQDYAKRFREKLNGYATAGAAFSCNCILNFLYGELEGKSIGSFQGPVTFGEIGYQLLNQTMVVLRVH